MSIIMTLPRLGETMETGRIVGWLKQPGETFRRGETLVEIETDKTVVDLPAIVDGTMQEILAGAGLQLDVGAPLCRYTDASEGSLDAPPSPGTATHTLLLPRLGETMETGRIVAWLRQPGEKFQRGEILVEIETDKTVVELPALMDGNLDEIVAANGTEVEVGAILCRYSGAAPSQPAGLAAVPKTESIPAPPPPAPAVSEDRLRATGLARSMARRNGIALHDVVGTGRRGRIEAADIEDRLAGGGLASTGTDATSAGRVTQTLDLATGRLCYRLWTPSGAEQGTIMLLHGFSGDSQAWATLAALLSRSGLRVLAPDLPAHGATTIPADDAEALAAPLVEFLDHVANGPLELCGHSLGAAVAVAVARQRPGLVRRLTLIAPVGLGSEIDGDFIDGMARVEQPGALAHLLRRLAVRPPKLSKPQLAEMVRSLGPTRRLPKLAEAVSANGRQQIDLLGDLEGVRMPCRILWGTHDAIIPWTQVAGLPSRIGIHLLNNSGHMPQWDQPQELAELLSSS